MKRFPLDSAWSFGLTIAVGLLALGTVAQGQGPDRDVLAEDFTPTVFSGRVVGPDGLPASGAVVVTSVGGQAVSGPDGSFLLDVMLSPEADSVHVTAVAHGAGGQLTAHTRVGDLTRRGTTPSGTLYLSQSADCSPSWLPTFGGQPGANARVHALTVFDDGSGGGPALYVAGEFSHVGGTAANRIAKWDGSTWTPLGSGLAGQWGGLALAVFDDGNGGGPALYAGGGFTSAGGVSASHIAKWNGSSWSPLGSGVNGDLAVYSLAVFDDGSGAGSALYAGGNFTTAGGAAANRIAKWDGSGWSALGDGLGGPSFPIVHALTVFDDGRGGGPALYAGGSFEASGVLTTKSVASWNGSTWSAVGSGMLDSVYTLSVFDDGGGGGPALCAGGSFTTAGGVAANHVAKWDGSSWSPLGNGLDDFALALTVFDDGSGSGPALFAGGGFTDADGAAANYIAKWDGSSWSALGSGMNGVNSGLVRALTVFDDESGRGPALFAGGDFVVAGEAGANRLAKWTGSSWSGLGESGMGGTVNALTVFDDLSGSGPALYAGGDFWSAGGVAASRIAKWDGSTWSPLGSGIGGDFSTVYALAVFDDGNGGGPALYAGGDFLSAGGVAANRIARWDGSNWSPLGGGVSGAVGPYALAVFDDGSGPALYAGGAFKAAGGVTVNHVAKWNGSVWSALGSGVGGPPNAYVSALAVFNGGGGAALYAGGDFTTAGGVGVKRIAKWNGSSWSGVGGGMDGPLPYVEALTVFDDGGGLALYVGGAFTTAGTTAANRVAKWNGSSWAALGSGTNNRIRALAVFDDGAGGGPALYAGGTFLTAGGVGASRIAKWDGSTWSPLGSGTNSSVFALTSFHDANGMGPVLGAGGSFSSAIDSKDSYLATWVGCPVMPEVWTDLGSGLDGVSGVPSLAGSGTLEPGSPGALTLSSAKPSALTNLFVSFASTPTSFKGGMLVPVPPALILILFTNGIGSIPLSWPLWPAGIPPATSLYFQYAVQDAAGPAGVALSNALRATTP